MQSFFVKFIYFYSPLWYNYLKPGDFMALKEDKDRINIVIEKEYKEKLQQLAKENRVTLSNFCATVLVKYIENKKTRD